MSQSSTNDPTKPGDSGDGVADETAPAEGTDKSPWPPQDEDETGAAEEPEAETPADDVAAHEDRPSDDHLAAEAAEDAVDPMDDLDDLGPEDDHHEVANVPPPHADDDHHGSGFAATALKVLLSVLVIFGLAVWLLPIAAPHLPGPIGRHLMPGQQIIDERLAEFEARLTAQTDESGGQIEALQAEIASLQANLAAAEKDALEARTSAQAAVSTATESARAAESGAVSEDVIQKAESAARIAAQSADTATTAATEAAQVASAATRDAAELARQMTVFEARLKTISEELGALSEGFAAAARNGGGTTTPELAAAFAALRARVDGIVNEVATSGSFITKEDARVYATQDDLRVSRTSAEADLRAALAALPPADQIATNAALGALRDDLNAGLSEVSTRIGALEESIAKASGTASQAVAAAQAATERVEQAIAQATLRAALAALTSRLTNGAAYSGPMDEIARLSGTAPPEELAATATTGVATADELKRGFGRAAQDAIAADLEASAGGGLVARATARVESIVAGRPKDAQEGDDAGSILSRAEANLRAGALADALAQIETLSEAARAGMGDWLARLRQRVAAEQAAESYAAAVTGSQG